ncbi:hypothetical protein MNBD_BACTEROID01-2796 [hydrothermal vent metagenome]|uniref:Uncharacterized protein n=1 Tax=hydrothermal vent metagenome TaxID=652676 RepID=A0A3B0UZ24_9ZZZZ
MKRIFFISIIFCINISTSANTRYYQESAIGYSIINNNFSGLSINLTHGYILNKYISVGLNFNLTNTNFRTNQSIYDESFSAFFVGPNIKLQKEFFNRVSVNLNGGIGKIKINNTYELKKIPVEPDNLQLFTYSQAISGEYWGNSVKLGGSVYYKTKIFDIGISISRISCNKFQKYRNSQYLVSIYKSF